MQKQLRRIVLDGATNMRDLGGYPAVGGLSTSWNRLYRSCSLSTLTDNDRDTLDSLGIKTVVDLRSRTEAAAEKDRLPENVLYFNIPIQDFEVKIDGSAVTAFEHSLCESYELMLKETGALFCDALGAIISGLDRGAVLFHCKAGKDRTGVMAAVILKLLGVGEDDIIADYQVSGTYNRNGVNKELMAMPEFEKNFLPILGSPPEMLDKLLGFFHSVELENYLIENGLSREHIESLKKYMLI